MNTLTQQNAKTVSIDSLEVIKDCDYSGLYQNQVGKVLFYHYYNFFRDKELLVKEVQSFNLDDAFTINNFNRDAFDKAASKLMERHESLRTVFQFRDGEVSQHVKPIGYFAPPITFIDIRGAANKEELINKHGRECAETRFDFFKGPLFRIVMVQTEDHSVRVNFSMNHIVADIYSLNVLKEDFFAIYMAYAQGRSPVLQPIVYQPKDYAAWQQKNFYSADSNPSREFWLNKLTKNTPLFLLKDLYKKSFNISDVTISYANSIESVLKEQGIPDYKKAAREFSGFCNRPIPSKGSQYLFYLDDEVFTGLKSLSVQLNTTMSNLVNSILCLVIYKLTKQTDIILAVATSTRDHYKLQRIVGWLMNYMLVRYSVDEESTTEKFISQNQLVFLKDLQHKHYPVDFIFRELDIALDAFGTFFVNFIKLNNERDEFHQPNHLRGDMVVCADIDCTVNEFENCMRIFLTYKTNNFTPETIEALAISFTEMCRDVTRNTNAKVKELR